MNILVTGVGGFIADVLSHRLLEDGESVFGVDNLKGMPSMISSNPTESWSVPIQTGSSKS